MNPTRILILGATGVDKKNVLQLLKEWQQEGIAPATDIKFYDFEQDFISHFIEEFYEYLDGKEQHQREYWSNAWDLFCGNISKETNVVLSMHAMLARPLFTNRSPLLLRKIAELNFTHIITLIDDIYDMWYRTEFRAEKAAGPLQPTLADLMETRRAETLLGDLIANNISTNEHPVMNFLLAMKHPQKTLTSILSGEKIPKKRIYVSHPISAPRKMASEGDLSGINQVNEWLAKISEADKAATDSVFFYPLTIDELPLRSLANIDPEEQNEVLFERKLTWNLTSFFGDRPLLCNYNSLPNEINLKTEQVNLIEGMLKSDVRFRDFRLVAQSRRLLVLNPWYENRRPRGVREEIDCALKHNCIVHIWQDPNHDNDSKCKDTYLKENGGTIKADVNLIFVHDNFEKAIERVLAD
jgi:hypothetical protein